MSRNELDPDTLQYIIDSQRLRRFLREMQSVRGARVPHGRLWKAFTTAYPHAPQGPEGRQWLLAALQSLETEHHVRLPSRSGRLWDRSSSIPVPSCVTVIRPASPPTESAWRDFPWHPPLQWVLACRHLPAGIEAFLMKVNVGLVEDWFADPSSLKYRSLQLTGNEKRLGVLARTRLFAPGRLSLEMLGCEPEVLPLSWESVSDSRKMIIFENAGAYMVGLRVLRSLSSPPFGKLAYGAGEQVLKAIGYLKVSNSEVESIEYVGDLDAKGIEIASSLQHVARQRGIPPVCPATPIHLAMLRSAERFGAADGWPTAAATKGKHWRAGLEFLSDVIRIKVERIIAKGHRIPEEVLGHHEMHVCMMQYDMP